MNLYASRTNEDLATERKMLLRRGFRFEEPLSLTVFESGTDIVMGHICGVLYFPEVLAQTSWELLSETKSLMTDDLTRNVFEKEYLSIAPEWQAKRTVLVLHDPVWVSDSIFIEQLLEEVKEFVECYYSEEIKAVYQQRNDLYEVKLSNGLVMCHIVGCEIEGGLTRYEYGEDV